MKIDVESLYQRFGPMVLRRCRALLRNEELAVDAMHDVFVRLLTHQDRLDETAPSSLLFRMATQVSLNRLRTHRRRPETREEGLLMQIAAMDDLESSSLARAVLGRLLGPEPESTRTIAVLLYVDGLTLEEVASEVGMSVSGVRKRMRTLKERLGEAQPPGQG